MTTWNEYTFFDKQSLPTTFKEVPGRENPEGAKALAAEARSKTEAVKNFMVEFGFGVLYLEDRKLYRGPTKQSNASGLVDFGAEGRIVSNNSLWSRKQLALLSLRISTIALGQLAFHRLSW